MCVQTFSWLLSAPWYFGRGTQTTTFQCSNSAYKWPCEESVDWNGVCFVMPSLTVLERASSSVSSGMEKWTFYIGLSAQASRDLWGQERLLHTDAGWGVCWLPAVLPQVWCGWHALLGRLCQHSQVSVVTTPLLRPLLLKPLPLCCHVNQPSTKDHSSF